MRIHVVFHGRVQGVGFRYSAKQKALELDVHGWVKNKEDGTVELEAEGNETNIRKFMDALKNGLNPFIKVTHIDQKLLDNEAGYSTFSVK